MKTFCMVALWLLAAQCALAQKLVNYSLIDSFAIHTDDRDIAALTHKLITPYKTEPQKARAVFRWITAHIDYDVEELNHWTHDYDKLPYNSSAGNKQLADSLYHLAVVNMVMRKRKAVCDGYSRLFYTMCTMAGIECKKIEGCSKTPAARLPGMSFVTDHAWNAVKLNKEWRLVDVTWASGHVSHHLYTRSFNENYYLAPPQRFAYNHYPEDTSWLLFSPAPGRDAYIQSPNKTPELWNTGVRYFAPETGVIRYGKQRTIHFELTANASITDAYVDADRDTHQLSIMLDAESPAQPARNTGKASLPHLKAKPAALKKLPKAERDAIDAVMDYANTLSDSATVSEPPEKGITSLPEIIRPYKITGKKITVDYALPEGLYKELLIFYNGEMILQYELMY